MTRTATAVLAALISGGTIAALAVADPWPATMPDRAISPGAVASTDKNEICQRQGGLTYSRRHRQTTEAMKAAVRRAYGITGRFRGEIDHIISLCLGGADDVKNLWPQSGEGVWNYHVKDVLEAHLCREVCAGRVDLQQAQRDIASDWIAAYAKYIGAMPRNR